MLLPNWTLALYLEECILRLGRKGRSARSSTSLWNFGFLIRRAHSPDCLHDWRRAVTRLPVVVIYAVRREGNFPLQTVGQFR